MFYVNTFTVKLTSYKTSDCTIKDRNHVVLANITIATTCNTACSILYFLR